MKLNLISVPLATSYGADSADKKSLAEILSYLLRPISVSIDDGCLCLTCFNRIKDAYNITLLATSSLSLLLLMHKSKKVAENTNNVENELKTDIINDNNQLKDTESSEKIETIEYNSSEEEMPICSEVAVENPENSYEISDDEREISNEKTDACERVSDKKYEQNGYDYSEEYECFVMDAAEEDQTNCEPETAIISRKVKQIAMFECVTCEKKFTFRDNLRRHMKLHSSKSIFDCTMCKFKSFSTKVLLFNHLYKDHQLPAPHSCTKCNAGFTYASQLKLHQITNRCRGRGENPGFICEVCSRPFVIASNLKRHLMIHTNEKPFNCGYCSKSFNQKQALIIHERIHSKETPIHCLKCPKKFSDPSSFKKHQQSHLTAEVSMYEDH